MTSLGNIARLRRPLNLASRAAPASCSACGARHHGICESLSDEELAALARLAQPVTLPAGAVLLEEGEPAGHVYNVNAGFIRLFKSLPDGRRQITGFAGSGHFLGLIAQERNVVSAEAMEQVRLCRFPRATMAAVFARFPQLEHRLLGVAMHELVLVQQQMLLLGRKSARERLASFLLSWAQEHTPCDAGALPRPGTQLLLPLSRTDLADYLGLTIETVSRSLSALKRERLIDLPSIHEVVLLRPQALCDLAEAAL